MCKLLPGSSQTAFPTPPPKKEIELGIQGPEPADPGMGFEFWASCPGLTTFYDGNSRVPQLHISEATTNEKSPCIHMYIYIHMYI